MDQVTMNGTYMTESNESLHSTTLHTISAPLLDSSNHLRSTNLKMSHENPLQSFEDEKEESGDFPDLSQAQRSLNRPSFENYKTSSESVKQSSEDISLPDKHFSNSLSSTNLKVSPESNQHLSECLPESSKEQQSSNPFSATNLEVSSEHAETATLSSPVELPGSLKAPSSINSSESNNFKMSSESTLPSSNDSQEPLNMKLCPEISLKDSLLPPQERRSSDPASLTHLKMCSESTLQSLKESSELLQEQQQSSNTASARKPPTSSKEANNLLENTLHSPSFENLLQSFDEIHTDLNNSDPTRSSPSDTMNSADISSSTSSLTSVTMTTHSVDSSAATHSVDSSAATHSVDSSTATHSVDSSAATHSEDSSAASEEIPHTAVRDSDLTKLPVPTIKVVLFDNVIEDEDTEEDSEIEDTSYEEDLLAAVYNGDITTVMEMLRLNDAEDLNLEYVDQIGNTPLKAAIQEGYSVIVEQLLKYNVVFGDAVLRAVDVGFVETVKKFVEFANTLVDQKERQAILDCCCEDETFHPDVTPLVLAAQRNDFAIVKLLLESGCRIVDVTSGEYSTSAKDSLQKSVGTLELYKGLASEAYVALATMDPIDKTFVLRDILEKTSKTDVEFKSSYLELIDTVNQVGTDIISQARSTEEILTVLTYHECEKADKRVELEPLPKLSRAIRFNQKEFVTTPNCQQTIKSKLYGRLSSVRDYSSGLTMLFFIFISFTFPVLSLLYLFHPSAKLKATLECPIIKFTMRLSSDLYFVLILTIDVLLHGGLSPAVSMFHPSRLFLLIWTLGIFWERIKVAWMKGFYCFSDPKQLRDTTIVFLLLTAISLDTMLYYSSSSAIVESATRSNTTRRDVHQSIYQPYIQEPPADVNETESNPNLHLHRIPSVPISRARNQAIFSGPVADNEQETSTGSVGNNEYLNHAWWHPKLVSTGLFAIACVLSYLRILPYVVISEVIGPLQISLGSMITQTLHFFVVVLVVVVAFAVGLTHLYAYYNEVNLQICTTFEDAESCKLGPFANLFLGMLFLYWSIFGLTDRGSLEVDPSGRVPQSAGYILYAMFYILLVIILLNALIAIMSNVYNNIEENGDMEWKFAATSMFMGFLEEGDVVPPPFNLLPSSESIQTGVAKIKNKFGCKQSGYKEDNMEMNGDLHGSPQPQTPGTSRRPDESQYQRVIHKLVERYVAEKTSGEVSVEAAVTVTDVRALRNDILTLKFEMSERLHGTNENFDNALGRNENLRKKSVITKQLFDQAENVHSEIAQHKEHVLGFKTDVHDRSSEARVKQKRIKEEDELLRRLREADAMQERIEMEAKEERLRSQMAEEAKRLRKQMDDKEKAMRQEMHDERQRQTSEAEQKRHELRKRIDNDKELLRKEKRAEIERILRDKKAEKERSMAQMEESRAKYQTDIQHKEGQIQTELETTKVIVREIKLQSGELFVGGFTQTDLPISDIHRDSQTDILSHVGWSQTDAKCDRSLQTDCVEVKLQEVQTDLCTWDVASESTQAEIEINDQFVQTVLVVKDLQMQTERMSVIDESVQTERRIPDTTQSTQIEKKEWETEISTQTDLKLSDGFTQTDVIYSEKSTQSEPKLAISTQTFEQAEQSTQTETIRSETSQWTQTERGKVSTLVNEFEANFL